MSVGCAWVLTKPFCEQAAAATTAVAVAGAVARSGAQGTGTATTAVRTTSPVGEWLHASIDCV